MTGVTYPNARRAVRDLLAALLVGQPEADGVTVSVKPRPEDPEAAPRRWVQVSTDSRRRSSNLDGRAAIRVRVWHEDDGLGEDLAVLCEALLIGSASTDALRGVSPAVGPVPTTDPDTGTPHTFFTITARLRPASL